MDDQGDAPKLFLQLDRRYYIRADAHNLILAHKRRPKPDSKTPGAEAVDGYFHRLEHILNCYRDLRIRFSGAQSFEELRTELADIGKVLARIEEALTAKGLQRTVCPTE